MTQKAGCVLFKLLGQLPDTISILMISALNSRTGFGVLLFIKSMCGTVIKHKIFFFASQTAQ